VVKIITATEAMTIHSALKDAKKLLLECDVDEEDMEDINYALQILKGLKEKSIEEALGLP
jgi:hypothetical protein